MRDTQMSGPKMFLMIAIGPVGLMAATGCGSNRAAGTPSGAVTPTPSQAAAQVVVTATTRSPDGTVAELHLVRLDGSIAASVAIPDTVWNTSLPVVGHHAYFVDGTTVKAVASDGSVASVGTLMLPSRSSMYSLAVGIAISPDESEIAYGYAVGVKASASGAAVSTYASRVFVERVGGSPHQLIDAPADANGFLLPFAWSTRGLWVTHTPIGLGGAGPFLNYQALNPSLVNPTTGAVGQMQSSCRFPNATSVRPSGASACIVGELTTPRSVTVTLPDQSTRTLPDPAPSLQLGDFAVRSDGARVALSEAPQEAAQGSWSYGAIQVGDSAAATWSTVGPRGMLPVAWVDANRLLVGHTVGVNGPLGAFDGVFLLDITTGTETRIDSDPAALGALPVKS